MAIDNVFDLMLPDPNTYTVVINERMRRLIHTALGELIAKREDLTNNQVIPGDDEVLESLVDLFDNNGSTGPLEPSPAVNGFVL
jgi:hypothetical protein